MALAAFVFIFVALFAIAPRAEAAEQIYWDNYTNGTEPFSVSFANIDGSGGGEVDLGAVELDSTEGMAYDSVTNRMFVASSEAGPDGQVVFVGLDGSGAGILAAPGAEVARPVGVAVDPATRTVYWANSDGGPGEEGSIGWARIDGSVGGLLNTAGATVNAPYRIALDPFAGRVYWANGGVSPNTISYANIDNSGGGDLEITGASVPDNVTGLSVDPAAGRLYWLDNSGEGVSFVNLADNDGTEVDLTGASFEGPYGLALDPSLGKLYWGNYSNGTDREGAIGFASVLGGGGGIEPLTAPVNGPQDPVVIKSPTGTAAPQVNGSTTVPAALSCTQGSWGADYPGSFVYQAPRRFAYQWTLNGAPIQGATAPTLAATTAGAYACTVTATNQAGRASQASGPLTVQAAPAPPAPPAPKAALIELAVKKNVHARPGGVAVFKVRAVNQGDLRSSAAKVCVKLSKKASKALKPSKKCKALGKVGAGAKDSVKLRIKVGEDAHGTYKVKFVLRGSAGKSATTKIVVVAPKSANGK